MKRSTHSDGAIGPLYDFNLSICTEKRKDNGEDAILYAASDRSVLACALDGCGGSGAKQYPKFRNKTGAYMASRVVFGAVKDWYLENGGDISPENAAGPLKQKVLRYLEICNRQGGEISRFKGNISKDFPTTAAIEICTAGEKQVNILSLWAGDSRCYVLTPEGLMQLSDEDLYGYDAMENLMADGVLTNVISASKPFEIHSRQVSVPTPCVAFTATDGCFGYYTTPMEFEFLLLDTLEESSSPVEWEKGIISRLNDISGDDFTLSGFALGFGTFEAMQQAFALRHEALYRGYIKGLSELTVEEKIALWHRYSPAYSRHLAPPKPAKPVKTEVPVPPKTEACPPTPPKAVVRPAKKAAGPAPETQNKPTLIRPGDLD